MVGPSITRVAHLPELNSEPTRKAIDQYLQCNVLVLSIVTVSLSIQPELLDLRILVLVGLLHSQQLLLQLFVHTLAPIKVGGTLDDNKVASRDEREAVTNLAT